MADLLDMVRGTQAASPTGDLLDMVRGGQPQTPQQPVSTVGDMLRAVPAGLAQTASGTLNTLTHPGAIAKMLLGPFAPQAADSVSKVADFTAKAAMPTAARAAQASSDVASYEPQTIPGQYTKTISSFFPAAIGGTGGMMARAARVAVPAVTSETAGQLTKGTAAEPWARLGGGLLGGIGESLAEGGLSGSGPTPQAQRAHDAGYTLPPNMVSDQPSGVSRTMNALGGKLKTYQDASLRNQDTTNALAATDVGLPPNQPITVQALRQVRNAAEQTRDQVRNWPQPIIADPQYQNDVAGLQTVGAAARQQFPNLVRNPELDQLVNTLGQTPQMTADAGIDLARQLRYDGAANIRAYDAPQRQMLGLAQRRAADAIEGLIDRNLSAAGQPDLVNQFREARQLIAKTFDIESALNRETGDVKASVLGGMVNHGAPMTGNLRSIAGAQQAFPRAMQTPQQVGGNEGLSIFDVGLAGATHGATAPLSLGRLAVRPLMLSGPYQNALFHQPVGSTGGMFPSIGLNGIPPILFANPLNQQVAQ